LLRQAIISSAFEGVVGTSCCAQLAAALGPPSSSVAHGLGTGRWFAESGAALLLPPSLPTVSVAESSASLAVMADHLQVAVCLSVCPSVNLHARRPVSPSARPPAFLLACLFVRLAACLAG
jgi:hypothetical protein